MIPIPGEFTGLMASLLLKRNLRFNIFEILNVTEIYSEPSSGNVNSNSLLLFISKVISLLILFHLFLKVL